jgi:hypothetical protein
MFIGWNQTQNKKPPKKVKSKKRKIEERVVVDGFVLVVALLGCCAMQGNAKRKWMRD